MVEKKIKFDRFENEWPDNIESYTEIWLIGGDGTLNFFINKYPKLKIPVALFAGGTGNDFHWKIYHNMNYSNQVDHVLNAGTKKIDLARCNDKYFINMIGIGFDGEVLKSMSKARYIGGHMGYLIIVLKNIFSYKEVKYQFTTESTTFTENCLLCNVSNSNRTGGGFMVSPQADIYDGKLNFLYCTPLNFLQRIVYLSKVEKGSHLSLSTSHHQLVTKLKINAENEVYYQLDGELLKDKEFDIEVIPEGMIMKF